MLRSRLYPHTRTHHSCARDKTRTCYSLTLLLLPRGADGCPAGTYMQADCTANSDRVCTECTTKCPAGQYMIRGCNATHDAVCVSCTPEDQVECKEEGREFFIIPCSAQMDARYTPLSSLCFIFFHVDISFHAGADTASLPAWMGKRTRAAHAEMAWTAYA